MDTNKRSKHTIARLDHKTKSVVRCGSCGRELAHVLVVLGHKNLTQVRVLYLSFAWHRGPDGVYRLRPAAANHAKEKELAYAWPRHGKKLVGKLPAIAIPLHIVKVDYPRYHLPGDPEPENVDEESWLAEAGPELPIEMECYNCHTRQLLTAEELDVEETLTGEAPYHEQAEKRGLPQIDNRKIAVVVRKAKAEKSTSTPQT